MISTWTKKHGKCIPSTTKVVKKHGKCIPPTRKVVKGGLYGTLYGGLYDPVHKAIRDVIDKSYKRILTSMAVTILKGPSLPVAIAEHFYLGILELVTNFLPRILNVILLFGISPVLFVGKIFRTISERFDAVSRTNIVTMLNKYKKNTDVKISYSHVWHNISETNEIVVDDLFKQLNWRKSRTNWLLDQSLPADLSFDKVSTEDDKKFLEGLKEKAKESIIKPIREASSEDKAELLNTIKPQGFKDRLKSIFKSVGQIFTPLTKE